MYNRIITQGYENSFNLIVQGYYDNGVYVAEQAPSGVVIITSPFWGATNGSGLPVYTPPQPYSPPQQTLDSNYDTGYLVNAINLVGRNGGMNVYSFYPDTHNKDLKNDIQPPSYLSALNSRFKIGSRS